MIASARFVCCVSLSLLTSATTAFAQQPIQAEGLLERVPELVCGQGTHTLWAVCGNYSYSLFSSRLDLASYECEYDSVQGPNAGIACSGIIDAQSISVRRLPCTIEVESFQFDGENGLTPSWSRVPCAVSYDVIRGDVQALTATTGVVDLGPVTCLQDDVPATSDILHPIIGSSDPETPPLGRAFFYLVRAKGSPYGFTPYSVSTDGLEGVPSSGDCAA